MLWTDILWNLLIGCFLIAPRKHFSTNESKTKSHKLAWYDYNHHPDFIRRCRRLHRCGNLVLPNELRHALWLVRSETFDVLMAASFFVHGPEKYERITVVVVLKNTRKSRWLWCCGGCGAVVVEELEDTKVEWMSIEEDQSNSKHTSIRGRTSSY